MNTFIRFALIFFVLAFATFGVLVATKIVNFNAETQEGLIRALIALLIVAVAGSVIYKLAKDNGTPAK